MNGADERIAREAAAWLLATDGTDADWDAFTEWLEADPAHRHVYDEIALADAALRDNVAVFATRRAENEDGPAARGRWPLWAGAALAASIAALVIAPQLETPAPAVFESGATPRMLSLAANGTVILAPHSKLTIAGRDRTQLALDGAGYFAIRHDPSRTLQVAAGGLTVTDVGTQFDIRAGGRQVLVEVREGAVSAGSETIDKPIALTAGKRLLFDSARLQVRVSSVPQGDVGSWREGRLSYQAAPLGLVAADLARYAGVRLEVANALADRQFSGTLFIGHGDSAVQDLAQLMAVRLRRDGDVLRLEPVG
jgi:transmembrane sensor